MANTAAATAAWTHGELPPNVSIGPNSLITGHLAFKRFRSRREKAMEIGAHCTMEGVHFNVGDDGYVHIGDYCYLTNVVLLCELEVRIGSYVMIGWNVTIADSDFHPIAPAERIADAISQSPLGKGRERPFIPRRPIFIGDDVCIGPNATILKGVRIGAGAFVEAGAMVTRDVAAGTRVMGNPAQVVEDPAS